MIKHEKRCYKNPDRYCEACDNTGYWREDYEEGMHQDVPCHYCRTADEVKEIMKKEEEERKRTEAMPSININEIPF